MNPTQLIGVDIGGTNITAGLIVNGMVVKKTTVPTESQLPKERILDNLLRAINEVFIDGAEAIGIGVPGLVDAAAGKIIQITNIPSWNGFNLKQQIEKKLDLKTSIENDANCFVLGVKRFGEGVTCKNIVGISLGTGLGAGLLLDNKLYKGLDNGAGEICFIPYKDSNLEAYCSGSFFTKSKQERGEALFKKAMDGDSHALSCWDEYGIHISYLVRIVLLCYAPELIVFGGSAANGFPFFKGSMIRGLQSFEMKTLLNQVKIQQCTDNDIAIKGAAALAIK